MATLKFTALFVENIKVENGRTAFLDTHTRGLELRVTGAGAKTWAVRYTRKSDGRRRRVTLGTFPAISLEAARVAAQEKLIAAARGADPASQAQERRDAQTFREVSDEWEKRHGQPNKGYKSLKDDRRMLDRHILPQIGGMIVGEIQKRDIIRLLDVVAATPDARKSKGQRRMTHRPNRVFALVRSIFRWALGRDLVKSDPTAGVSAPIHKEKPRERALSRGEIGTVWTTLAAAPDRRALAGKGDFPMTRATALAMKLALVTAQRIGEVSGIEKCEYDLAAAMWVVPGERSKNGEPNRVPLSSLAIELIREAETLAGDSQWLFPSPKLSRSGTVRGPIDPHAATKALARSAKFIKVDRFRVHDLRRTAATGMAELGVSPHTISLVLNHRSARKGTVTGAVYVQYTYDREKREALDKWAMAVETAVLASSGDNVYDFKAAATA
ncbi:MAG: tyrosine-type recombinase/integrase [Hyphomicrobium sp.]|jgi:integrase|uniref:tyrosine-type recombinase/integrase n=1 Tax=Hyphomicrobium sp. TaxID=82 RepID=UPI0025C16CFD|nr:site-specific integrase [Hyphomicrobium sp.]MBX9863950.1 tyrosine-type recombinase/integrase [Hyphomicrobium sp.]